MTIQRARSFDPKLSQRLTPPRNEALSQLKQAAKPSTGAPQAAAQLKQVGQTLNREPSALAHIKGLSSFEPSSNKLAQKILQGPGSTNGAPPAGPAGAPPAEVPVNGIREDRVDDAVYGTLSPEDLDLYLKGDSLTEAEKGELVARLAKDENKLYILFGTPQTTLEQNERVAEALNTAFKNDDLSQSDLLELADQDQSGLGAQRFAQLLATSPEATEVGGALDSLGQALSRRADRGGESEETDRRAAAIAFTSSPELMEARLNTPAKRENAFRALSDALVSDEFRDPRNGDLGRAYQEQLVRGSTELFAAHGPELVDRLTQDGNQNPAPLANFFAGALFSPAAQGVELSNGRKATDVVQDSLADVNQYFTDKIANAADDDDREAYARQLGRAVAGLAGGAEITLRQHREALADNKDRQELLAGLLGGALGKIVPGGVGVDQLVDALTEKISQEVLEDPDKPDLSLSGELFNAYEGALREFEDENGYTGVVTSFNAGYGTSRDLLRDYLDNEELE
jgi:hypothetical protein